MPIVGHSRLLALCLVAMVTKVRSVGQEEESPMVAVKALYHSSVNFTCTRPLNVRLDLNVFGPGQLRRLWILPNDDLLEAGTDLNHERVDLLDDGATLHVRNVDDVDFGLYYCVVHVLAADVFLVQKHGLNVDGPYWGDLYQLKYKSMVTTGLVAGSICLVSMAILCFCYGKQQGKLDQQAEDEKAAAAAASLDNKDHPLKSPQTTTPSQESSTYVNVAFVHDAGEDSQRSQKPVTQQQQQQQKSVTQQQEQQKAVTQQQQTTGTASVIAVAPVQGEVKGGKHPKGQAPGPPSQELRNVAAADGDEEEDANNGGASRVGIGSSTNL